MILRLRAEEQKIVDRDRAERAAIALAFNRRYSVAARYDTSSNESVPGDPGAFGLHVKQGYRWMCPTCNALHAPLRNSVFVGLIYPSCCKLPEGSRHLDTPTVFNLFRPIGWCGPSGLYLRLTRAGMEVSHDELKKAPY